MKEQRRKHEGSRRASVKSKIGLTTLGVLGPGFARAGALKSINPKWVGHYRMLMALRERLLEERSERRTEAAQPLEPHSMDIADSATDEFDHDLALAELSAEQDALCEVDQALKRVLNGTYGICEETGEAIPAARLRAVPWTRFTREVEERLEKKGVGHRAQMNKAGTVRGKGRIWFTPEEEAEEVAETPSAPPKDEALSCVFSPPGRHVAHRKISQRQTRTIKGKGRQK